jgi:predicted O-methyltransferase YrrM
VSGEADVNTLSWRPDLFGYSWDILPFYRRIAKELPEGARVVEVGVLYGRSILFMAEELARLGKAAHLWAVDSWEWAQHPKATVEAFRELAGSAVTAVKQPSIIGTLLFEPHSLDFVFIDADHTEAAVRLDLDAWVPRMKPGALIAGHDYHRDEDPHVGVRRAVDGTFGAGRVHVESSVWSVRL